MARCNLPAEERAGILNNTAAWIHGEDELERCRDFFENYLFIERDEEYKDKKTFTCSYCKNQWRAGKEDKELFRLKHKEWTKCPMCGKQVMAEQIGRLRVGNQLYQTAAVSFINVLADGAVTIESGICFCEYACEYQMQWLTGTAAPRMDLTFIGKKRYYMRPGAVIGWKRYIGTYFERAAWGIEVEWTPTTNITEAFSSNPCWGFDGFGYFVGMEKLADSALKYSQIDRYYEEYHNRDIYETYNALRLVPQYLAEYALNPQIEMAVKLGMSKAVGELVRDGRKNAKDINWKATNPADFARLNKAEAKVFYTDPSLEFLKWYHTARKLKTVRDIREAKDIVGKLGIPRKETMEICSRYGISLRTAAAKLKDQTQLYLWVDYVSMAEKLGYDLTAINDLLPWNLRERHDAAVENLKIKEDREASERYEKIRKALERKYAFTADGLSIVIPRGVSDIVAEGQTLHICVGGYAHRHVERKTTILFLRHERRPERSFICIELNAKTDKLVQIHGYKNEGYKNSVPPKEKYKEWLDTWLAWVAQGSPRDRKGNPIIRKEEEKAA